MHVCWEWNLCYHLNLGQLWLQSHHCLSNSHCSYTSPVHYLHNISVSLFKIMRTSLRHRNHKLDTHFLMVTHLVTGATTNTISVKRRCSRYIPAIDRGTKGTKPACTGCNEFHKNILGNTFSLIFQHCHISFTSYHLFLVLQNLDNMLLENEWNNRCTKYQPEFAWKSSW